MAAARPSIADKRRTFRELHAVRLLRHPQSVGHRQRALSAKPRLQGAGDDQLRLRVVAGARRQRRRARRRCSRTCASMVAATDLPVNADFESGFARRRRPASRESVRLAVATGVAGLSIEDSTGDAAQPLYDARRRGGADARGARARSTRPAATRCSSAAPKASSSAGPTSTRRSRGSRPTRTPAPIASTRRASARASRSRRWCGGRAEAGQPADRLAQAT